MASERKVEGVYSGRGFHWVGDGFRVNQIFPGAHDLGEKISPWLMMDYHAPFVYEPTERPRGVGVHPHRGIETVTLAFEGSVEHKDSTGAGGIIGPGDVQWMTAAGGILHREHHEREWAKTGGQFHMMQLWVNLPAANKMDAPRYQGILADDIKDVEVERGVVHVIAGAFADTTGPASTHSPVILWRAELKDAGRFSFSVPESDNIGVFVLQGDVEANGTLASEHQLILFDHEGTDIEVNTLEGAHLLILGGTPLGEPVVSYGPFVMNTKREILEAIEDFQQGRFGYLDDLD